MSENQPEYKVSDQPAAIIESPRQVLALSETGLIDYRVWGWVKISAKFIAHIRKLKGAKLAVWQTMALSINEFGECELSAKELASMTGYSRSEIIESQKELDKMGYLSVTRSKGKMNIYKPEFAARGGNIPTDEPVQKNDQSSPPFEFSGNQSSPSMEKSDPSFNRVKRVNGEIPQNMPLEWYIKQDLPVPAELTEQNRVEFAAIGEFESAFGFGQLPWDSTTAWQSFKKWVVKIYQSEPTIFRDYVKWRNGAGKYDAMSNKKIRENPKMFVDTGYPTYKASSVMYGERDAKPL